MATGKTKEDRIKTVYGGGGQVVILGAGASIAATLHNSEVNGRQLPSMNNFIEVVGLNNVVETLPERLQAKNFEVLYSKMHSDNPESDEIKEIEKRVYEYFKDMRLPNEPTIYDYLVLSLRPRDLIATFNWDPFLYQAFKRNRKVADLPHLSFLHGNVAIGYSKDDKRWGEAGMTIKATFNYLEPTRLLFPVEQKDYNSDEFTKMQWEGVKDWLHSKTTKIVTIFGYGAPATDVEAIKLMNEAWGTPAKRNMEQFEIIDVRSEGEVTKQWDNFIHTHHYDYCTDYFESSLALNPRRTFESYFQHIMPMTIDDAFSESNPIPSDFKTMEELWDWHKNLIVAENEWKEQNPDQVDW